MGGSLSHFPVNCFFPIPAQIPQSQPVLLKFKFHSHFLSFLFHESQSHCTKSHFTASKKGKSHAPILPLHDRLVRRHVRPRNKKIHMRSRKLTIACECPQNRNINAWYHVQPLAAILFYQRNPLIKLSTSSRLRGSLLRLFKVMFIHVIMIVQFTRVT